MSFTEASRRHPPPPAKKNTSQKRRRSQPAHPLLLPRPGGARALPSIFLPSSSSSSSRASDQGRRNLASRETGRRTQRGIESALVPGIPGPHQESLPLPKPTAPRGVPAPRPGEPGAKAATARERGMEAGSPID